jgi:ABC-2 type transport system permease protein
VNPTIGMLTVRTLLGRRRAWLLAALPAVLLVLTVILRLTVDESGRTDAAPHILGVLGLATVIPLLGLIAGTGAIGGEIDDGSIIYLLAKPVNRHSIVMTKLAVAAALVSALGALPVLVAGWILVGSQDRLALGYALGALVAGITYCAGFLLLAVVTRNAVVIGLIYALVWETAIGSIVPGAQTLSIQQWSLALTRIVVGDAADPLDVTAAVRPQVALPLLLVVLVGSTAYAGHRLRSLRLTSAE